MDKLNCREDKIDRATGKKKGYIITAVSSKLAKELRDSGISFIKTRKLAESGDLLDALDKRRKKWEQSQTGGI